MTKRKGKGKSAKPKSGLQSQFPQRKTNAAFEYGFLIIAVEAVLFSVSSDN